MEEKICYKCGKAATSREHVPPICLFPQKKDLYGIDFRQNLITVPSCEEHNAQKSSDDEFLLETITSVVGNNVIGYVHTQTKIKRIYKRKGQDYINKIAKNVETSTIKLHSGIELPVMTGLFDNKRLIRCFEHIACGLYFNEFKKVFHGKCTVLMNFLKYQDEFIEKIKLSFSKIFELNEGKWLVKGSNPLIFKYQFGEADGGGIPLKMTFYNGSEVLISFVSETFDLTYNLIEAGQKITIDIGNGKTIEFNSD